MDKHWVHCIVRDFPTMPCIWPRCTCGREIVETPTCPVCEIKIDDSAGPAPADDGVTEANLRDECSICGLTFAQAWAAATGKTEAAILAEYDEIRDEPSSPGDTGATK